MANCNDLFQDYHGQISIGSRKNERMKNSKEGLRDRIRSWFKKNQPDYVPFFYIQGSYKMKVGIRTSEDICDLDDGIYFFREPDVQHRPLRIGQGRLLMATLRHHQKTEKNAFALYFLKITKLIIPFIIR